MAHGLSALADRFEGATSVEEVLTTLRQYLSSRAPGEVANLPVDCGFPDRITPDSVVESAYRLASRLEDDDTTRTIQRFASVFTAAAVRVAELRGKKRAVGGSFGHT